MAWTSDDDYVENSFKEWEEVTDHIRKNLPQIFDNATKTGKIIISMLVHAEFENAINIDNNRRHNGAEGIFADKYREDNKEIFKKIEEEL